MKWLAVIALLGLAPIWRDSSWKGGVNIYEAIYKLATLPQKEHIPVQQALEQCRRAYQESLME